jgi:hypothetical protein
MWISKKRWETLLGAFGTLGEMMKQVHANLPPLLKVLEDRIEEVSEVRQKYEDALERMVQMRREGFQPPTPVLTDTEPDGLAVDITAAIVAVAGESGPLHDTLTGNAYRRVGQGWPTEAIVEEVYDGQDVDALLG